METWAPLTRLRSDSLICYSQHIYKPKARKRLLVFDRTQQNFKLYCLCMMRGRCLVFLSCPVPAGEDGNALGREPRTLDMYTTAGRKARACQNTRFISCRCMISKSVRASPLCPERIVAGRQKKPPKRRSPTSLPGEGSPSVTKGDVHLMKVRRDDWHVDNASVFRCILRVRVSQLSTWSSSSETAMPKKSRKRL